MQNIEKIIKEIAAINSEDGFYFNWFSAEELRQPHMKYNGFRVTLDAQFGKMQDRIQIDIGIGDVVTAIETTFTPFEYKGKPIFAGEISLYVYPPEAIFAEKKPNLMWLCLLQPNLSKKFFLMIKPGF